MNTPSRRGTVATTSKPRSTGPKNSTSERNSASRYSEDVATASTLGFSTVSRAGTAVRRRNKPPSISGRDRKNKQNNVTALDLIPRNAEQGFAQTRREFTLGRWAGGPC